MSKNVLFYKGVCKTFYFIGAFAKRPYSVTKKLKTLATIFVGD